MPASTRRKIAVVDRALRNGFGGMAAKKAPMESNGGSAEKEGSVRSETPPAKSKLSRSSPRVEASPPSGERREGEGQLADFPISDCTRTEMAKLGYERLLPVQCLTFDSVFQGLDVVCKAKTGTGKTLAFSLPLVEKHFGSRMRNSWHPNPPVKGLLKKKPGTPDLKVLAVLPTRELAQQVHETFASLACGRFAAQCIFGGAPEFPQENALRRGCDVLVATPGRLLAFLQTGAVSGPAVSAVVLDEADKLLEMGFREDIESLLQKLQEQRRNRAEADTPSSPDSRTAKNSEFQLLLFTATFPTWARDVARNFMTEKHVFVDATKGKRNGEQSAEALQSKGHNETRGGRIEHLALQCHWKSRCDALPSVLCTYTAHAEAVAEEGEGLGSEPRLSRASRPALAIIFCETKQEVNDVALNSGISKLACALHGDLSQQQREATLKSFRKGVFKVLVATDVAARGLDVSGVSLVVQMSPPRDVETYIHRAGRTGRAGRSGVSLLFFAKTDADFLVSIEREGRFAFRRVGMPLPEQLQAGVLAKTVKSLFPEVKMPSEAKTAAAACQGEEALAECFSSRLLKNGEPQRVVSALLLHLMKTQAADGLGAASPNGEGALSLLTARPDFCTFILKFSPPPATPLQGSSAYVWRALKNQFSEPEQLRLVEALEHMTLLAAGDGAVFEIDAKRLPAWERLVLAPLQQAGRGEAGRATASQGLKRSPKFSLEKATTLPPLQDALFLARQTRDSQAAQLSSRQGKRINPNHVSARRLLGKDGSRESERAKRRRVA